MVDVQHMTCPKCQGNMARGFITEAGGVTTVTEWIEGLRENATLAGKPEESRFYVGTYRCSSCGYLDSYARPEFKPGW